MRRTVDLNDHLNDTALVGKAPDVELRKLYLDGGQDVPRSRAVVRVDTGEPLAVVSDQYRLVTHNALLALIDGVVDKVGGGAGKVPRGIYFEKGGAKLRALYKFPHLARTLEGADALCPLISVANSYDGTTRVAVGIGAFRFVCTNLAIGGGGAFASGFRSLHKGEISFERVKEDLEQYLNQFENVIALYKRFRALPWNEPRYEQVVEPLRKELGERHTKHVLRADGSATVFDAYNRLTQYATHDTRSAATAFRLLDWVNRTFQELVN